MYGIDLSVQIANLMPSLGLGFLLGFIYDAVRFFRLIFSKSKIFLFVTDMLFVVFCTLVSFLLFLGVNNGNIRFYLILAEITGSVIYFCTAGIIIFYVFSKIADAVKKSMGAVFAPFLILRKKIGSLIEKTSEKWGKKFKKNQNKFKKPLQDDEEMLYNIND